MRHYRMLVLAVLGVALVAFACGGGGSEDATPTSPSLESVSGEATETVCHLAQKKVDVPISQLEEHFSHGDWLVGPEICDGEDNDCDGQIDEGCEGDQSD